MSDPQYQKRDINTPGTREALRQTLGTTLPLVGAKWAVKRYGVVVEESGVREGNPSVIRDGDQYRMYCTRQEASGGYHITLRTSNDGKTWSSPTTVMDAASVNATGYDVPGVSQPCILKVDDTYYLYFQGRQMQPWGARARQIFMATSIDGETFSDIIAVITPRQNSMEADVWHPYVQPFRGKYYMTCIVNDDRLANTNPMRNRLMLYSSSDLETWTSQDIINMEGALGEWDAGRMFDHSMLDIKDSLLLIVYAAEANASSMDMRIGLAYSFDMDHWFGRKMMLCRVLDEEDRYVADSSILYEGGKLKIWYEADDGVNVPATGQSTVRVMYAEATMGEKHIMELWDTKTVPAAGLNTDDIDTKFDEKTFYLISDQDATVGVGNEGLYIQAYDEIAGDFKTIDTISVTADELTPYMTDYDVRRMRLRFIPTAEAEVSAWAVMQ